MDETPISARRVVLGFALSGGVALLPVLVLLVQAVALPSGLLADAAGVDRVLLLGVGSVVLTMALVGLAAVTVTSALRLIRRPSRA